MTLLKIKPMCTAALEYVARGWEVFPAPPGEKKSCKAAKHSGGVKWGKTTNARTIRRDFLMKFPDANVAIVTGVASGIFVIEADTTEGHDVDGLASIRELETEHGALPETLTAISPSGSVHRYYQHPGDGIKIKNSYSEIAPGVDIRGDGGMMIAPPSIKPGVGCYRWANDLSVAVAPSWLLDLIAKTNEKPERVATISERASTTIRTGATSRYVEAALGRECDAVASSPKGSRNARLNRSAFNLGTLVGAGKLNETIVTDALLDAANANGLVEDDGERACKATITSGLSAGIASPRSIPEQRISYHHDIGWLREMVMRGRHDA